MVLQNIMIISFCAVLIFFSLSISENVTNPNTEVFTQNISQSRNENVSTLFKAYQRSAECDCGEYGDSCSFDILGYRSCTCKPKSVLLGFGDKICVECDCGIHSISCMRTDYGSKLCECMEGYQKKYDDIHCTKIGSSDEKGSPNWQIWTSVAALILFAIIVALSIRFLCKR